ncbi:flagellar export protein FliJ [Alkalihalobacillus sp. LMS39]|uniref:flagellar export protein FliJ n=1 Tax=Alkalihalobacillus sp. LMS39 TaxID=2924032 RepID=UPI001FB22432|nr:flagellar export protein FliJ [Alkalihalobacillus sp. LMS39]UOE92838.1 flagellar export protein FliJ [Alkalihalobacillus sp. LMS39]
MTFQYTLQKVLEMKEKEKQTKQLDYHEAAQTFEDTATALYNLLKKREKIEDGYREQLSSGMPVHELLQHQTLIMRLQQEIEQQQFKTNIAREQMYQKQDMLTKSAIEFKTYEKMKENKHEEYMLAQKAEENKLMDEIAVQLYANR